MKRTFTITAKRRDANGWNEYFVNGTRICGPWAYRLGGTGTYEVVNQPPEGAGWHVYEERSHPTFRNTVADTFWDGQVVSGALPRHYKAVGVQVPFNALYRLPAGVTSKRVWVRKVVS